jgi:hypothetical protein
MKKNRKKLNKCSNSRDYKITQTKIEYDYCFICAKRAGSYYYDCSPMTSKRAGRHGSGKIVSTFDAREFRTWKHTRKKQWKNSNLK